MKIERRQITIGELVDGFEDKGYDGVVAYGGKLDVRPAYQREFVYGDKQRDEVIRSVMKGFPLNVMYWSKTDGGYELMDGQQRTISICKYVAESEQTFSVDFRYWFNLQEDERFRMLDYPLDIYVCDGTPSEVLGWFKVINIAGLKLTDQELRNTSYTGPWLADAKRHFSKPTCAAYSMARDYLSGSPIRQDYLQTAIAWIADRDGVASIEDYMAKHQKDENANQIWLYFQKVIQWVEALFPVKRSEMKGIDWGFFYNAYKDEGLDPDALEAELKCLMSDDEVHSKKGTYAYVLTRDEKHLNLRQFSDSEKRTMYERQNGVCAFCDDHFEFSEMQGDHVVPWSKGGKTTLENGQMLCAQCNGSKGAK